MKATVQQEDLQLLGNILQERLVAQVPDSQEFRVKCAIKNDELMILTQHPYGVTVDTKQVFEVLEQALQWQFNYQTQRVQFFLRIFGEKLPYAKHFLNFQIPTADTDEEKNRETVKIDEDRDTFFIHSDVQKSSIEAEEEPIVDSFSSSSGDSFSNYALPDSIVSLYGEDEEDEDDEPDKFEELEQLEELEEPEEKFDPFANIPEEPRKRNLSLSLPPLPIIIGATVVIALFSASGVFVLHRGCVISECKELQTAQQFKNDYQQRIKQSKSEKDLLAVQQKLDEVVADLQNIPQWSPRYQDSQQLVNSFSEQSTKINQVLKALQMASLAQKKTQAPAESLDELRNRQKLWKQAITSLEMIKPGSDINGLVKANLPKYKNSLKSINQQLVKEETWLKKIADAKTFGENAAKRQASAKSVAEWQRVESDLKTAINTLKVIPVGSLGIEDARQLLADYQPRIIVARDRLKKEQLAATFYQQAIRAVNQAKTYANQNQWRAAINFWQQALQKAQQVNEGSFYFNQAKVLIQTYTPSLRQAEEQFQRYGDLTQTRSELNGTCTSTIRICTFTIENQKINVRLTPEYDRLFQANNPEIQSHFQSLTNALKVIGQNAQLPVFVYNSQGQERYMKQPQ